MSLDQFSICSKIDSKLRKDIKFFHVFDDKDGLNVLFITNNDLVYGFGQNTWGCCGLGHNNVVNEPLIIPELCYQSIKQFSIGLSFISALNNNGKIFAWGNNIFGQLGKGYTSEFNDCLKPTLVNLKDEIIEQVQCGSAHSLVLDMDGFIYGWGANNFGQIGCGLNKGKHILIPTKLKLFSNSKIQYIYCSYNQSFALTFDGLVYSWGDNEFCDLGYDSGKEKFICEPKLIEIINVKNICFGAGHTYFLTNEGHIYFCGKYIDDNKGVFFDKIPKFLNNEIEFNSLHSIPWYQERQSIPFGINREGIYQLFYHKIIKTKYNSIFELYAKEFKMCFKTIDNSFDNFYEHLFQVNKGNQILDQLEKFSRNSRFKDNIKGLHIFTDQKGSNALLITSDDKVFSFGSNFYGVCGFGHDNFVEKPRVISELSNKNINKFIIGMRFVLAQDDQSNVYGWGGNVLSEMEKTSVGNKFCKPENILFPNSQNIIQISCGSFHSLALSSNGKIYGWGDNELGQIGCGKQHGRIIPQPIELKIDLKFKSIYCSFCNSFALTINGLVYSWGYNQFNLLGHELVLNEIVFEPKLIISLSNVINVCQSSLCTYFLTNEGNIYFCGKFSDENNIEKYQKLPKLLDSEIKFQSLHSVSEYQRGRNFGIALNDDIIYKLDENSVEKTNYNNLFNYYKNVYNLTHKTVYLNEMICSQNENISESQNINSEIITLLNNYDVNHKFKVLCELGSGAFATVLKVEESLEKRLYALKKISIKDPRNILQLEKEVNVMRDLREEFVVKYYNSGIEGNNFYIQMELFSDNLKNIIQQKSKFFMRDESKPMNTIEYFISCQLFKELLECVQYLHESNPPIIHRDLKPANILISEMPQNNRFLKLADFGLAIPLECNTITLSENCGTAKYMAIEVFSGIDRKSRFSTKSDIFSLGIISQELFDFDISSSNDSIIRNKYLRSKWYALKTRIEIMLSPIYKSRPNCSDLLSDYSEWGIDESVLINSEDYQNFKVTEVENNKDNFFIKYLNTKTI